MADAVSARTDPTAFWRWIASLLAAVLTSFVAFYFTGIAQLHNKNVQQDIEAARRDARIDSLTISVAELKGVVESNASRMQDVIQEQTENVNKLYRVTDVLSTRVDTNADRIKDGR